MTLPAIQTIDHQITPDNVVDLDGTVLAELLQNRTHLLVVAAQIGLADPQYIERLRSEVKVLMDALRNAK